MLAMHSNIFSQQCPPSALKIQMPVCDSPINLRASIMDCSKLSVSWKGNNSQLYIVEAIYTASKSEDVTTKIVKEISCNDNGNCNAIIPVKEGVKVDWSIQSKCIVDDATFYSYKFEGKSVFIPVCTAISKNRLSDDAQGRALHVYPNPASGHLKIAYYSSGSRNIQLKVFDAAGKMVITQAANSKTGNNLYSLNLSKLLPGVYMLTVNDGAHLSEAKFTVKKD